MGPVAGVLREVRQGGSPRRGDGTGEGALRRGDPPFPSLRRIFRADPGVRRVPPEAGGDRGGRGAPGNASGGRPAGVPIRGTLPSGAGGVEGGAARGGAQGVPRDRRGEYPPRNVGTGAVPRRVDRRG